MKIVRRDFVDWDPLLVSIFARPGQSRSLDIRSSIASWMKRKRCPNCGGPPQEFGFVEFDQNATAQFQVEDFCDACLDRLAADLESEFREIERLEIGTPVTRVDRFRFLNILSKIVEFENGIRSEVGPFSIAQWPVLVGEFDRFIRLTGYSTQSNYRTNSFSGAVTESAKMLQIAHGLSFNDAIAYCEWSNFRLPTEAEWLAASIVDDRIYKVGDLYSTISTLARDDLLVFGRIE